MPLIIECKFNRIKRGNVNFSVSYIKSVGCLYTQRQVFVNQYEEK